MAFDEFHRGGFRGDHHDDFGLTCLQSGHRFVSVRAVGLDRNGGMGLERAFLHGFLDARHSVRAHPIVDPHHADLLDADGAQVLDHFFDLIAMTCADMKDIVHLRRANGVCAGDRGEERYRRAFLGQHGQDTSHIGRTRDAVKRENLLGVDQLTHRLLRIDRLIAVVQNHGADFSAVNAALFIDLIEVGFGGVDDVGC